jgi:H+-transporting ATPase
MPTPLDPPTGLTSAQAEARLKQFGLNAIPEKKPKRWLQFLGKFWGVVPVMLEVVIGLDLAIGRWSQSLIILALLLVNALLSYFQERRSQNALELLKHRMSLHARVLRDGNWQTVDASQLVPDDLMRVRMGDFVPADGKTLNGLLSVDRSALTGEALPITIERGETVHTGSIVQYGEATVRVTATGTHTRFGRTAELIQSARSTSHLQRLIVGIVQWLVGFELLLMAAVVVYSLVAGLPWLDFVPFTIMLLVAAIPIALPAVFTLASALGAQSLAGRGVIVTRLAAVEDAAAMDTLCSDKTGTLTRNHLELAEIIPLNEHTAGETLRLAALGCEESSQDAIDLAIIARAQQERVYERKRIILEYHPFSPRSRRTELTLLEGGRRLTILKGAPEVLFKLAHLRPIPEKELERMAERAYRVIAVATRQAGRLRLAGLLGFRDPPRPESRRILARLKALGLKVVMVTGDNASTAGTIAAEIGLGGRVCSEREFDRDAEKSPPDCDVIAGVLPEDKFHLVRRFQHSGHVTGMTGDGVNDAPALRQAEVGIAVSNATDVAKAAASVLLTRPGLADMLPVLRTGREIHQRMLTYTLNKIIKTLQISLFLGLGLFLTGGFVVTPLLVVLLLFANDFVTTSLASDRVRPARRPEKWNVRSLVLGAFPLGLAWLLFVFGVYYAGRLLFRLDTAPLQTLCFTGMVFSGLANVYLIRERGHFWSSRPGRAVLISSLSDVAAVWLIASLGILVARVAWWQAGLVLLATLVYMVLLDLVKVAIFKRAGVGKS